MTTYDIEVAGNRPGSPGPHSGGWYAGDHRAYGLFAVDAEDEDEAEEIVRERITRGDIGWEDYDGNPLNGEKITEVEILTIEEVEY